VKASFASLAGAARALGTSGVTAQRNALVGNAPVNGQRLATGARSASAASRCAVTIALLLLASTAQGQVTKKKRPAPEASAQTVEIRGQVPTPQVVTVRPRAVPDYSRGVLVPAFYDQHFWPSILAPYRVVPTLPSESAHRPPEATPDTAAASPPPSRE
jgi:hypothetical protein